MERNSTEEAALRRNSGPQAPEEQECCRCALKIKRQAFGDAHQSVAVSLNNLAMLHHAQGDAQRAEGYLGEALRILLRRVGRKHFQYCSIASNHEAAVRDQAQSVFTTAL